MKTLALTGGIATGKSTLVGLMKDFDPELTIYDCDQAVGKFLKLPEVLALIEKEFGPTVITESGELNRAELRDIVFNNPLERKNLERILHPRVRKECLEQREIWSKKNSSSPFVADVPLLFENDFDIGQEEILVVATSVNTQRARLKLRNGFDDTLITSILSSQLPIMEKVAKAEVVFWNEGPVSQLKKQLCRYQQQFFNQ